MLSTNQGCAPLPFWCPAHGCVLCLWTGNGQHGDWMVTFILLSLGPVVDGLADGVTGLVGISELLS